MQLRSGKAVSPRPHEETSSGGDTVASQTNDVGSDTIHAVLNAYSGPILTPRQPQTSMSTTMGTSGKYMPNFTVPMHRTLGMPYEFMASMHNVGSTFGETSPSPFPRYQGLGPLANQFNRPPDVCPTVGCPDYFIWPYGSDKSFTLKFCYDQLIQAAGLVELDSDLKSALSFLWKMSIPLKVKIFGWRLFLDRLPTRSNLAIRNVINNIHDKVCVFCFRFDKDINHLFVSCPRILLVWKNIGKWDGIPGLLLDNCGDHFRDWVTSLLVMNNFASVSGARKLNNITLDGAKVEEEQVDPSKSNMENTKVDKNQYLPPFPFPTPTLPLPAFPLPPLPPVPPLPGLPVPPLPIPSPPIA
ncbi:hypothetical protein KIW84_010413 [Lathyrus oleraceus]|uniref:Reverse transcriptase zinc-binding domain-containing protein n=1 Tax=Pisum sativum TaxID=3888 RepID=A0A9D5B9Q7_PEA|nr:hypothetical protein KIW84_010413 [Pisum sativum]